MADHRNVGRAVLDGVRDAANPWIFPELMDEGADPWSAVTMVCIAGSPQATHATDVTGFLERGIASLGEHARYLAHVGTEADPFLRGMAEAAGARARHPARHVVRGGFPLSYSASCAVAMRHGASTKDPSKRSIGRPRRSRSQPWRPAIRTVVSASVGLKTRTIN